MRFLVRYQLRLVMRLTMGMLLPILLLSSGYIAVQVDSSKQTAVSVIASYGMQIAESYSKKLDIDQMERFLQDPTQSDLYWSIRAELNELREQIGAAYVYTVALDEHHKATIMIDGLPPESEQASDIGEATEIEPEQALLLTSGQAAASGKLRMGSMANRSLHLRQLRSQTAR
ncbi:hypothetical protein [Paenibacillus xylaniclasticus]|uniref:hypothetical protein n=1 Tax=Paenibacillus xylaniclasticus TaxID=588083 RepID=UPI000FD75F4D|nr:MULTISPECIES: hypothetical protein [Paenibacillus]GFN31374.1 hypothetical protein PCURB6_16340 [Paenibacillus curdlanolyticus]